jgi:hypothetical protein
VHLFAHWLDQQNAFEPVVVQLRQAVAAYKQAHPGDDFALLHHREQTLMRRFQALFFAPLLGIDRLSEFDTHEHPLGTLIGRGYQSTTLSQFLGQLERVGADEALMPVLLPEQMGQIIYVDGHMIAYWSRLSMHKGKITMLGRIMAGSQAVIAHDEAGQAVFVAYHPPDIHLSRVIVAYCQKVAEATGSALFVIDRAVNSVALACAFNDQGLGLLCMPSLSSTGQSIQWPWLVRSTTRAWACFACSMTTNMMVWRALRPPWWRAWKMARRSIVGHGKSPDLMIPGTL